MAIKRKKEIVLAVGMVCNSTAWSFFIFGNVFIGIVWMGYLVEC